MVITPDILAFLPSPNMNCVQYEPRHPLFTAMGSLDREATQWMSPATYPPQTMVKEEPRDETEFHNDSAYGPSPTKDDMYPANSAGSDKLEGRESSSSNSEGEYYENSDSLKRLQMALQRSGMVTEEKLQCPVCEFSCSIRSQFNDHLLAHERKCSICEFQGDSADALRDHMRSAHERHDDCSNGEEELNTPKVNSQGKVKTFRCKQCEFVAVTKLEFWQHSGTHIKPDRRLSCPKCPFVTEYKHHLDYHLRNHYNSKPFKCNKCSYTCVNKSMLNSHLKSHSNVYQFRCSDCQYATKYCHSLKLHLRKYNHKPAMVLNPDGSPNPYPIVDVYGTRRGPKQKQKQHSGDHSPQHSQQSPQQMFNPYALLPTQMPYFNILNSFGGFSLQHEVNLEEKNNNIEKEVYEDKAPLDLSISEPMDTTDANQESETPVKNRRKGKAFKLERIALRLQQQAEEIEEPLEEAQNESPPSPPIPETVIVSCKSPQVKSCEADSEQKADKCDDAKDEYNCSYCDITFKDVVMYTMHMGYHGYQDPFKCNMCGQETADKLAFFIHIARISHS